MLKSSLELGLSKARSDCVNGDGAASSSGQSQFESPPNSPVSSSYSPLPSPNVEEEPQSEQNVPGLPAAAVSEAPSAAESGVSSSSNAVDNSPQTEWWNCEKRLARERKQADKADRIACLAYIRLSKHYPEDECPAYEHVVHYAESVLLEATQKIFKMDAVKQVTAHFLVVDKTDGNTRKRPLDA